MATVTGYTAARMKEIEDAAIIDGDVVGDDLILTKFDSTQINAGNVRGPQGIQGPVGPVQEAPLNITPYARKNGLWVPTTETAVRDTLASLNTNNPVVAVGRLVIATDSSPRIVAIGDGVTAWNSLPKYYARSASQSAQTLAVQNGITSNTTYVDRTGLIVTFTVGDVPWMVIANESLVYSNAAGSLAVISIRDSAGVTYVQSATSMSSTATGGIYYGSSIEASERITTPGTYTRKMSISNGTVVGSITFGDSGGYYARLRAFPEP